MYILTFPSLFLLSFKTKQNFLPLLQELFRSPKSGDRVSKTEYHLCSREVTAENKRTHKAHGSGTASLGWASFGNATPSYTHGHHWRQNQVLPLPFNYCLRNFQTCKCFFPGHRTDGQIKWLTRFSVFKHVAGCLSFLSWVKLWIKNNYNKQHNTRRDQESLILIHFFQG